MKAPVQNRVVLGLFCVSSAVMLLLCYYVGSRLSFASSYAYDTTAEWMKTSARFAAELVTAEELDEFQTPGDMDKPLFEELRQRLVAFADDNHMLYVFYIRGTGDGMGQYILDNDLTEETVDLTTERFELTDKHLEALSGHASAEMLNYAPGYDNLISGFAPVYDAGGQIVALAGVDLEDYDILDIRDAMSTLLPWMVASLLIIIASGFINVLLQMRTDRARLTALENAVTANRAKSDFLASMSHEIRTPMSSIIGMTELLLHERLNRRQKGYVSDIGASAQSLLAIINEILDLSKIEAGQLDICPVDYDFRLFMDNLVSMFEFVSQDKGLSFVYEVEGELPHCLFGDDVRLRQVLTNICGNAVKFTEEGSVSLKATASGDNIRFDVTDTGQGIRREDIPKIFNAFMQTEEGKKRNLVGTGLGLSISKAFVEMMGGTIWADSVYGEWTTFSVVIPKVPGDAKNLEPAEAGKEQFLSAPDALVLVVDDNPYNLKVAQGLLSLSGIRVHTALSGRESIEMVQRETYDLVFMDHMMPEMDGIEATAEIRRLGGKYKTLPIIALTANAVHGAREMFMGAGFSEFLSKPIDTQKLRDILEMWLPPQKVSWAEAHTEESGLTGFIDAVNAIEEINTGLGLRRASGKERLYHESLGLFTQILRPECEKLSAFLQTGDLQNFSISIHAMKGMLATLGAMRLSDQAFFLEKASKNNEETLCATVFPDLLQDLLALREQLAVVFPEHIVERTPGDPKQLGPALKNALEAADAYDSDAGMAALGGVLAYDFGEDTNDALETAMTAFRNYSFGEAREALGRV